MYVHVLYLHCTERGTRLFLVGNGILMLKLTEVDVRQCLSWGGISTCMDVFILLHVLHQHLPKEPHIFIKITTCLIVHTFSYWMVINSLIP